MYYVYILYSRSSNIFYYGSTLNVRKRLVEHNSGKMFSTKPHIPWVLVWYCGFTNKQLGIAFEKYLKSGSGKAFAYKRLVALVKDSFI